MTKTEWIEFYERALLRASVVGVMVLLVVIGLLGYALAG